MMILKRNDKTGLECGINDEGMLYLGDDRSGYNLPNTPDNLEYVLRDFDFYNK